MPSFPYSRVAFILRICLNFKTDMISFILNEKLIHTQAPPGMVVVDFIRYHQQLTGTKIGCREGDCGACTVLVGEIIRGELQYRSVTCCLMPLANVHGKHLVTVEGTRMGGLSLVQQVMSDEGATQCGFCTPGIVMSLTGFCLQNAGADSTKALPASSSAIAAVDGNICRCTGYKSIERAAIKVAAVMLERNGNNTINFLTGRSIVPGYFLNILKRLELLRVSLQPSREQTRPPITETNPAFLGGGTDLYVQKHQEMVHTQSRLLSVEENMKGITVDSGNCILGGSVTVSDLANSSIFGDHFPRLSKFIKLVSSTPIRNMATVAGNFVNASPIGDLTIFFLALDAELLLTDGQSATRVPLQQFYKAYKVLNKKPGEFIRHISFQLPGLNTKFNFEKVSKRTHLDIASVNTAIKITMEGETIAAVRISAGGVGPTPLFLSATSEFLAGKPLTAGLIRQSAEITSREISPISDVRGTAAYKRLLLQQLIKAHFVELFPEMERELV